MRLLLIAKFFPPANSIASHRLYSFAKYLPQFGIDVDVLTPERHGSLDFLLDGIRIFHPNKENTSVTKFVKKSNLIREIGKYTGIRSFRYYCWSPFFLAAKKWLTKADLSIYDAVMASFGPEDVVHIAYFIHKKAHLPLILDYRDLWLDNVFAQWTLMDRLVIRKLERNAVSSALLITAATEGLKNKIEKQYGRSAKVIYNGFFDFLRHFDHEDKREVGDCIRICYTGSLYGGIQPIHVLFPLLKSNAALCLDIAVQDRIDVELVNSLINRFQVTEQVHLYENLSHQEAIQLQRKADILLFLNRMDGKANCVLSGKLFEYMAAGKFILGIGHPKDEARGLFEEYNLGAYATNEYELGEAVDKIKNWHPPTKERLSFFNRRKQAEILAEAIKKCFSAAKTRRWR